MDRDRASGDDGRRKIGQRGKSERRWAQAHQRRVADRADAFIDVVVVVRQQIGGRGKGQ